MTTVERNRKLKALGITFKTSRNIKLIYKDKKEIGLIKCCGWAETVWELYLNDEFISENKRLYEAKEALIHVFRFHTYSLADKEDSAKEAPRIDTFFEREEIEMLKTLTQKVLDGLRKDKQGHFEETSDGWDFKETSDGWATGEGFLIALDNAEKKELSKLNEKLIKVFNKKRYWV